MTMTTTTRTPEQIALVQRVVDWLAAGAPHFTNAVHENITFSFGGWIVETKGEDCGTTCCIAGAILEIGAPEKIGDHMVHLYAPRRTTYNGHVGCAAAEMAGVNMATEYDVLFRPFGLPLCEIAAVRYPFEWGCDLDETYPLGWTEKASPEAVARVLDHWNRTGVIDWRLAQEENNDEQA